MPPEPRPNNRFSLLEQVIGQGLGPPTHRHPVALENFLVLEGVVVFHIDDQLVRAEPGTSPTFRG
jgi:quercetin dioxygenase-like cupin family protein